MAASSFKRFWHAKSCSRHINETYFFCRSGGAPTTTGYRGTRTIPGNSISWGGRHGRPRGLSGLAKVVSCVLASHTQAPPLRYLFFAISALKQYAASASVPMRRRAGALLLVPADLHSNFASRGAIVLQAQKSCPGRGNRTREWLQTGPL